MSQRLLIVFWAYSATLLPVLAADEPAAEEKTARRYREGPLTAKDFLAPPPERRPRENGVRLMATTVTEVVYEYRFQLEFKGDTAVMTLTEIDLYAVVHRDRSWNTQPRNLYLMDHEQGHFDLTEISARQARHLLAKLVKEGALQGTGKDEADARRDLIANIAAALKPLLAAHKAAQEEYDRLTRHGTLRAAQSRARKRHRELLRGGDASSQ